MLKNRSTFILLLLVGLLLLSGCSGRLPGFLSNQPAPISQLSEEAVFIDRDAIYNRTLALIQSAQSSIYVEQAEFDDPQLIQLMMTKSQAGIDVRIILDQWQRVNQTTLDQLKSQNVSIQFLPAQRGQISHTKYMVIDHHTALIYGPPWTASGLSAHDLAVELSGRAAWQTAALFAKDWKDTTTFSLPVSSTSDLPSDNVTLAANANVKSQISKQISASKNSIWIATAEISDPELIQALLDAADKVPEIRLILDKEAMSKAPESLAALKSKNISIRFFPSQPKLGLHLGIFDNASFLLSSSDWTRTSFVTDHELSITVPSPAASAKLGALFQEDWIKSTE